MVETALSIWAARDDESKDEIVSTYVDANSFLPGGLLQEVAEAIKFRTSTIRRARGDQLARLLRRAADKSSGRDLHQNLLTTYFMHGQVELLSRVYDAFGVGHDGVEVQQPILESSLDADLIRKNLPNLIETSESHELLFCMQVMAAVCTPAWAPAVETILAELQDLIGDAERADLRQEEIEIDERSMPLHPISEQCLVLVEESCDSEGAAEFPHVVEETTFPEFTALDRLLIRSVVSSVNETEGAIETDDLDDLVQEVLELNDSRVQSQFHRGFLDALAGREVETAGPGTNRERRAWYLVGYSKGTIRREGSEAAGVLFTRLSDRDQGIFLEEPGVSSGLMLIGNLVRPLLFAGHTQLAEAWIRTYLGNAAPVVLPEVVEWARYELVDGDAANVERVLDLCNVNLDKLGKRFDPPPASLVSKLKRRLAVALRLQGKMTAAEAIVDELLTTEKNPKLIAPLLGDKLLIRLGIKGVEGLKLGEADSRASLLCAVDGCSDLIGRARKMEPHVSPVIRIAAALPSVVKDSKDDNLREEAARNLEEAIIYMGSRNEHLWRSKGVDSRAKFYLSLVQLRAIDPTLSAQAVGRLMTLLNDGLNEPIDLLSDAVNHAVIQEAPKADLLARELVRRQPQRVLMALDLSALVKRSVTFRASIVDALEANQEILTSSERWGAWCGVLAGALAADEREIELACRALDELESLAELDNYALDFAALLDDRANWDPAWSQTEVDLARFRVLEAAGDLVNARASLSAVIHRAISEGSRDVIDLFDLLESLGAADGDLVDIRHRLSSAGLAETTSDHALLALTPKSGKPVRVLFIGGDERQAIYEADLRVELEGSLPGCSFNFQFPGWGSNWNKKKDFFDSQYGDCDAVVIMRFVRTHFGRYLRKLAAEYEIPWIACTGHGRDSILRSVLNAVEVVRR